MTFWLFSSIALGTSNIARIANAVYSRSAVWEMMVRQIIIASIDIVINFKQL